MKDPHPHNFIRIYSTANFFSQSKHLPLFPEKNILDSEKPSRQCREIKKPTRREERMLKQ